MYYTFYKMWKTKHAFVCITLICVSLPTEDICTSLLYGPESVVSAVTYHTLLPRCCCFCSDFTVKDYLLFMWCVVYANMPVIVFACRGQAMLIRYRYLQALVNAFASKGGANEAYTHTHAHTLWFTLEYLWVTQFRLFHWAHLVLSFVSVFCDDIQQPCSKYRLRVHFSSISILYEKCNLSF